MNIELGKVYDTSGPDNELCVIMLKETWVNLGTYIESQRKIMASQDKTLKDTIAANTDLSTRLGNLRAIRREEKRPEIEKELSNFIQG